jgi:hypothetical protein
MGNSFFGIYKGVVTDNVDPENLMRLKVTIPDVPGKQETRLASACFPSTEAPLRLPPVGTDVWILFEAGNPERPVWIGEISAREQGSSAAKPEELQLKLVVNRQTWSRVQSFESSGPDDRHYVVTIDRQGNGMIRFGDGKKGRLPPQDSIITTSYRFGGGSAGNVPKRRRVICFEID